MKCIASTHIARFNFATNELFVELSFRLLRFELLVLLARFKIMNCFTTESVFAHTDFALEALHFNLNYCDSSAVRR